MFRFNLKSRMYETAAQSHSSDTVGDERREEMMSITSEVDPFNTDRAPVKHYSVRSTGSPFASLTSEKMEQFVAGVKENFAMLYLDRLHPGDMK